MIEKGNGARGIWMYGQGLIIQDHIKDLRLSEEPRETFYRS
jgi:hypothetical protein